MIIEIPDDNSIVKWKKNDKEDWKTAEISDLIKAYENPKKEIVPVCKVTFDKEQLQEIVDKAVAELVADNKRPEGKWIDRMVDKGYVECPFCHKQITGGDLNFCVKCGADMKGDANGTPIKTVTNAEEAEAYPISEDIRKAKKIAEILKKYGSEEEQ